MKVDIGFCFVTSGVAFLLLIFLTIQSFRNGFKKGSDNNFLKTTDHNSNICGVGLSQAYPYAYIIKPYYTLSYTVCVKQCPSFTSDGTVTPIDCYQDNCDYNIQIQINGSTNRAVTQTDNIGYATNTILNRFCLPTSTIINTLFKYKQSQLGKSLFIESKIPIQNLVINHLNFPFLLIIMFSLTIILIIITFILLDKCHQIFYPIEISMVSILLLVISILVLYLGGFIGAFSWHLGIKILNFSYSYLYIGILLIGIALLILILGSNKNFQNYHYNLNTQKICHIIPIPIFLCIFLVLFQYLFFYTLAFIITNSKDIAVFAQIFTKLEGIQYIPLISIIILYLWVCSLIQVINSYLIAKKMSNQPKSAKQIGIILEASLFRFFMLEITDLVRLFQYQYECLKYDGNINIMSILLNNQIQNYHGAAQKLQTQSDQKKKNRLLKFFTTLFVSYSSTFFFLLIIIFQPTFQINIVEHYSLMIVCLIVSKQYADLFFAIIESNLQEIQSQQDIQLPELQK